MTIMRLRSVISGLICGLLLAVAGTAEAAEFDTEKVALIRAKMQRYIDENVIAGAVTVIGSLMGRSISKPSGYRILSPLNRWRRIRCFESHP
jgi:hypothetical protein